MAELTIIQQEIYKVLDKWSEKAIFTESALAKQIRANTKLQGKNKAGLSFRDVEAAIFALANDTGNGEKKFSLHANSANDLLIKKSGEAKGLDEEARKRRQSSEKSMSILTAADFMRTEGKKMHRKDAIRARENRRAKRESINIYSNFDEEH